MVNKTLAGIVFSLFSVAPIAAAQGPYLSDPDRPKYNDQDTIKVELPKRQIYKNNIINVGTFTLSDVSVEYIRRLKKDRLWSAGLDYAFIKPEDKYRSPKKDEHSVLAGFGVSNDGGGILLKSGPYWQNGRASFNYGAEIWLTFSDGKKAMPTYGFSFTKKYVHMKVGITF